MFHLNFNPAISSKKLSQTDEVIFIGSCFSEHISKRLIDLKFNVKSNPFGIVFNPLSINSILTNCINKSVFNPHHFIERDNTWFHLDTHSQLNANSKDELNITLNQINTNLYNQLQSAQFLFITFGSAYVYEYKPTQQLVANCHKLSNTQFNKRLLTVNEIVTSYNVLCNLLQTINPNLQIVFTVSPVKHLRDGIVENNLSKSILIQSVHEIVNKNSLCSYFPVYELVNDDLRDYRFYEPDMAHPNQQAVNYVFDKFSASYFNEETIKLNKEITEINLALNHKPFNEESVSHKAFKLNMIIKCKELVKQFPFLNLTKEINYFEN